MRQFPTLIALQVFLVCARPVPGIGQSPAQRAEIERFRDSIAVITDAGALRNLETDLIAQARQDRSNAMLHLRLGFLALRLGELSDGDQARRHFDDAGSEFEWATQEQPNWPYGWYGLGFAELALGDSEIPLVSGFQMMLGKDALTRSANAFARSAEVDPGFVAGLVELSSTALRQRINARMDVALAALRRASRTPSANAPELLLARGRVERAVGSLDSSAVVLEKLLRTDSTNVLARYEMARTRFLEGDSEALGLWYGALSAGDSSALDHYREDLEILLPDSILQQFDAANGARRVELVRQFWESRDDDELHARGARLAEHYRRLDYVRRHYRLVSERRRYGIEERYRSGQSEYDDRGIIYLRHGAPDERVRYSAPGIEPNESWLYRRESGDLIFHFVAREDVQDFRLVESLFDVLSFADVLSLNDTEEMGATPRGAAVMQHTEGLLRSREPLHPIYSRLLGVGRGGASGLMTEERRLGQNAIAIGTTTDSWPLDVGEPIEVNTSLVAVGADSTGAQLQVAFAIPGEALAPRDVEGGFAYPVRLRGSVIDLDGRTVARFDTTRVFRNRERIEPQRHLVGRLPVRVPAGTFTVRVALETDRGGMVTARDTIHVAPPVGNELGLSDLAVGARAVRLAWETPAGDSAWLNPTRTYRRTDPVLLYFEVSGLEQGEEYEVRLELRRPRGGSIFRRLFGGGVALRMEFDQVHPGGIDRVSRELDIGRLSSGDYSLEVRVKSDDGREVFRRQLLRVVE
jgi:GWxTD domain-containing protein